jgi:hypothetical protein
VTLQDLDRGIVHHALRPATNQANAALSSEQLEFDNLLLEMVALIQVRERSTLREAERHVAEHLQKVGVKRRGKTITPATLRSLRNHPRSGPKSTAPLGDVDRGICTCSPLIAIARAVEEDRDRSTQLYS